MEAALFAKMMSDKSVTDLKNWAINILGGYT